MKTLITIITSLLLVITVSAQDLDPLFAQKMTPDGASLAKRLLGKWRCTSKEGVTRDIDFSKDGFFTEVTSSKSSKTKTSKGSYYVFEGAVTLYYGMTTKEFELGVGYTYTNMKIDFKGDVLVGKIDKRFFPQAGTRKYQRIKKEG